MKEQYFSGTGVSIVTPLRRDGSIHFKAYENIITHLIDGGVDYIVAGSTSSECATLSKDEYEATIGYIKEQVDNRCQVVVNISGFNTQEVINTIKDLDFEGIHGLISTVPFYIEVSQKGIYSHFRAIASASPVPIIIENNPAQTMSAIEADTVLTLAKELDNIVAISDSSGDFSFVSNIIRQKSASFNVICGNDRLMLPMLSLGASGVFSIVANAYPMQISNIVNHALNNDFKNAQNAYNELFYVIEAIFIEGNPQSIKATLRIKDIIRCHLRPPLSRISRSAYMKIQKQIVDFESTIV